MKLQWFPISACYIYIKRLCEIFSCSESQPFANLSIPVVGDLLQLPPIKAPQIFEPYNFGFGDFFNLWSLFVMVELTDTTPIHLQTSFSSRSSSATADLSSLRLVCFKVVPIQKI